MSRDMSLNVFFVVCDTLCVVFLVSFFMGLSSIDSVFDTLILIPDLLVADLFTLLSSLQGN